jgi:hypothetical protein
VVVVALAVADSVPVVDVFEVAVLPVEVDAVLVAVLVAAFELIAAVLVEDGVSLVVLPQAASTSTTNSSAHPTTLERFNITNVLLKDTHLFHVSIFHDT